jgi:predicted TPR repeat methyltransferase
MMRRPLLNPLILLSELEDGYAAYDPARDRLHRLNPTAALLAELCDGSRSVAQIRGLAAPLMPEGQSGETDRWIEEGIKAGLLVWQAKPPALTAKEQSRIALRSALFSFRRLGQTKPINALYRETKKSVRLNPSDWNGWYSLGRIAQTLGHRDEARTAYGKYLQAHPDDGEIEQILLALRDDAPPQRAADRTVRHIYRKFAATYDSRMREDLKYSGPEKIGEAIHAAIGERTGLVMLDLGCGSGLAGIGVRARARELVGVDLSPEMLDLARARGIYDRLEVAEITQWLARDRDSFDVIICCDCLIYFGDLGPLLGAAAGRLKPDGLVAISMERGEDYPFRLSESGRYTHHPRHLGEAAARCGLEVALMREGFLRTEYGQDVMGLFAILNRA